MADPNVSYALNIHRNKTKKWQTARQVNYGGEGWGDDDEDDDYNTPPLPVPQSAVAPPARLTEWEPKPITASTRSFTNPSSTQRMSYEKNDDRHQFNGGRDTAHFPSGPTGHSSQEYPGDGQQPPLHIDTQAQQRSLRGQQPPISSHIPTMESFTRPDRASGNTTSSTRALGDDPARFTGSSSVASSNARAPRAGSVDLEQPTTTATSATAKALPFVRPADIYKRMEEEREKERQSQESARPSIDSNTGEVKDGATISDSFVPTGKPAASSISVGAPIAESTFSEFTSPSHDKYASISRQTSSVYSNRRDPVSATSEGSTRFPLPVLNEQSSGATSSTPTGPNYITPLAQGSEGRRSPDSDTQSLPQFDRGTSSLQTDQSARAGTSKQEALQHQPSLGYRSIVHKAFDDEAHNTTSPSTTTESLLRSDSASTAEISPILAKKSETVAELINPEKTKSQITLEEPSISSSRPESTSTIRATRWSLDNTPLDPPSVVPGFRRDSNPPSPGNSPARQPRIATPENHEPETGVIATAALQTEKERDEPVNTSVAPNLRASSRLSAGTPPISRTASQDYQDWQESRRSFHAKRGVEENGNESASQSPSVLYDNLSQEVVQNPGSEGDRARQDDVQSQNPGPQIARPEQGSRLESFRPSLPGGWQSDTTISSSVEKSAASGIQQTPLAISQSRTESTESVPTAKAPMATSEAIKSVADTAFAAAAAAGTALAGSFSGSAFATSGQVDSDDDSEDEISGKESPRDIPRTSNAQDFAPNPEARSDSQVDVTLETNEDATRQINDDVTTRTASNKATPIEPTSSERQTPVDYPAPLRMSKVHENSPISPRPSAFSPTNAFIHEDPEQLQQDIVKSLTPKGSTVEHASNPTEQASDTQVIFPEREDSYDSVLPQEYSTYWHPEPVAKPTVHDEVTSDVPSMVQASAEPSTSIAAQQDTPREFASGDRPTLTQRFSWEKSVTNVPQVQKSSFVQDPESKGLEQPTTPTQKSSLPQNEVVATQAEGLRTPEGTNPIKESDAAVPSALPVVPISTGFASEKVDFKTILSYSDPYQRIAAFDENRRLHSVHNGLLDQWLASMNIPEHAEVFLESRQIRTQQLTPQQPNTQTPQSIPRRDISLPSGTKQMQEDGKRLLAAAGKYGGKAGSAAKGLFAKGKDKFRTASASDKVPVKEQPKSTIDEVSSPSSPQSHRSTQPSVAPQLPPHTLSTPVDEISWSLLSSLVDSSYSNETTSPHPKNEIEYGQRFSQIGIRGELTRKDSNRAGASSAQNEPTQVSDLPANEISQQPKDKPLLIDTALARAKVDHERNAENQIPQSTKQGEEPSTTQVSKALPSLPPATDNASKDKSKAKIITHKGRLSVSDVSDLSQSPKLAHDTAMTLNQKSSPPADDPDVSRSMSRSQEVPIFLSHDLRSKEAEAQQEREHDSTLAGQGSLPPYSSPVDKSSHKIAPGTQIVPIADLRGPKSGERRSSGRPFSFAGGETMSSVPSYHPGGSPPPLTPTEGQKRKSQGGEKNLEPDIMEHPAYRQEGESLPADQQVAENPLPSSRRPPHEIEEARRRSKQTPPAQETEGYRIPGPYLQEFRSPRPRGSAEQFQSPVARPSTEPSPAPVRPQPSFDEVKSAGGVLVGPEFNKQPGQGIRPFPQRPEGFRPVRRPSEEIRFFQQSNDQLRSEPHTRVEIRRPQENDKARGRTFGKFLRPKQNQRSREEIGGGVPSAADNPGTDSRKRKVFFKMSNRAESPVPQLGGLPEEGSGQAIGNQNGHRRLLSSDLLKKKNFGFSSNDGKRKRISGLAGLLTRGNNKDKARPSTSLSQRSDVEALPQHMNQQAFRPYGPPPGTVNTYPNNAVRHEQYIYYPPPHTSDDRLGSSGSAVRDPHGFYDPQTNRYYNEQGQIIDMRPDHLWVDTTNDNHQKIGHALTSSAVTPYTAISSVPANSGSTVPTNFSGSPPVPVTRARRDISYGQDRPYVPKANIAEHVRSLNKRSRSPRLGKPASDEHMHGQYNQGPGTLDIPDPAQQLGIFSNRKASPVGATRSDEEQEKPWTIALPSGHEETENENRRRGQQTYQPVQDTQNTSDQKPFGSDPIKSAVMASNTYNQVSGLADNRGGKLRQGEIVASGNRVTQPLPGEETSQSKSNDVKKLLLERTPSPFLSGTEWAKTSRSQVPPDMYNGANGVGRSTTPVVGPPASSRNFINIPNNANRTPTSPHATTMYHDAITTTTTTTRAGPGGLSTVMTTSMNSRPNQDTLTPVDRPPSAARSRQSQVRSPTPLQNARSPTPSQQQTILEEESTRKASQQRQSQLQSQPPVSIQNTKQISPRLPSPSLQNPSPSPERLIEPQTQAESLSRPRSYMPDTYSQPRPVSPIATKPHNRSQSLSEGQESKDIEPVELPGDKPDGYVSDDEPVMSATFFPGQEWVPTFDGGWED